MLVTDVTQRTTYEKLKADSTIQEWMQFVPGVRTNRRGRSVRFATRKSTRRSSKNQHPSSGLRLTSSPTPAQLEADHATVTHRFHLKKNGEKDYAKYTLTTTDGSKIELRFSNWLEVAAILNQYDDGPDEAWYSQLNRSA